MAVRKWRVVAHWRGDHEECARFLYRRTALMVARRWNLRDDTGWLYTVERVTPVYEVSRAEA